MYRVLTGTLVDFIQLTGLQCTAQLLIHGFHKTLNVIKLLWQCMLPVQLHIHNGIENKVGF
ncbi:hypothetical protein D3C81_2253200 [compost metagenome]